MYNLTDDAAAGRGKLLQQRPPRQRDVPMQQRPLQRRLLRPDDEPSDHDAGEKAAVDDRGDEKQRGKLSDDDDGEAAAAVAVTTRMSPGGRPLLSPAFCPQVLSRPSVLRFLYNRENLIPLRAYDVRGEGGSGTPRLSTSPSLTVRLYYRRFQPHRGYYTALIRSLGTNKEAILHQHHSHLNR